MSPAARQAADAPVVTVRDVNKKFGTFDALSDINVELGKGEKLVICGPSGSGKSTLIRCIAGLEKRVSGEISIAGRRLDSDCANASVLAGVIGMVFQQFNLFPHLTVLENLTLAPRKVLKTSKTEADALARKMLERVHLSAHGGKYPGQLSGGQQQRVAIARALCMKPQVLLFDEPTSALDPEMVHEVLDVMASLASEGMTMIVVTHEMSFARSFADRVLFLESGKIVEAASAATFFSAPSHERSKAFLRKSFPGMVHQ